jgi:hypothetical protein
LLDTAPPQYRPGPEARQRQQRVVDRGEVTALPGAIDPAHSAAVEDVRAGMPGWSRIRVVIGEVGMNKVPRRPKRWPYVAVPFLWLLGALSGPAYYMYATSQPVIGANIGAGFGLMWTAAWGWPWSLVPWNDVMTGPARLTLDDWFLTFVACALLNVALVSGVFTGLYLYTARRMRRHPETGRTPKLWHYAVVPLASLVTVVAGPIYLELQLAGGSLPAADSDIGPLAFVGPLSEQWNTLLGLPWSQWPGMSIGITEAGLVNVALVSLAFLGVYLYKLRRAHADA